MSATAIFFSACQAQISEPVYTDITVPETLQPFVSISAPVTALRHVRIFTGENVPPLENQTIVMAGERIIDIAPSAKMKLPENAHIIDLSGHSVMPGFIGMHNHLHMPGNPLMAETAPRLYLAGGVTTLQTTGSANADGEIALARSVEMDEIPGPKIFPTAPYISGPGGNAVMDKPVSEAAARRFVQHWSSKGAAWFKLYRHTDPDIAAIIIDEAHKQGRKVTGHLCSITYIEAALMGIDSLEHGLNAATDFAADKPHGKCVPSRRSKLDLDLDGNKTAKLIDTLVKNNVTLTSTLAILETGFPHRPQGEDRVLKFLTPDMLEQYQIRQAQLAERVTTTTSTPAYWRKIIGFERRFVEAGGHLVAGPDTGRHILPGFGDQRNFELLSEAGFSVPHTIKIMTYNGAQALGIDTHTGLIKTGYFADLIVLNGNPEMDTSIIRRPVIIFKHGLGYDPAALLSGLDGKVGPHAP